MSRVERTDTPTERREHRQAERGHVNRRLDSPGRTPGKAEGEERDVEVTEGHPEA